MKKWMMTLLFVCLFAVLTACTSDGTDGKASDSTGGTGKTDEDTSINFPEENITVIIPKSPGGGTDLTARGLIEYAKKANPDATIIGENNPGGGGVTGMVEGANAAKDGYTLTMTTVELAILPHLDRSPVTVDDFIPIVAPIADPGSLIVPADAPYDTLEEFIAYAKENPGKLRVGNSGSGAIWHLAAAAIEEAYDVQFTHVPYDGGSAPAVAELVGGHIDAVTVAPGNAKAQIDSGELKVLAVMASERNPLFPDVPTFKELGQEIVVLGWAALAAPAGTPQEIIDALSEMFVTAMKDEEFKTYMRNQGIEPTEFGPKELQEIFKADNEKYGELLKDLEL